MQICVSFIQADFDTSGTLGLVMFLMCAKLGVSAFDCLQYYGLGLELHFFDIVGTLPSQDTHPSIKYVYSSCDVNPIFEVPCDDYGCFCYQFLQEIFAINLCLKKKIYNTKFFVQEACQWLSRQRSPHFGHWRSNLNSGCFGEPPTLYKKSLDAIRNYWLVKISPIRDVARVFVLMRSVPLPPTQGKIHTTVNNRN
jgi:hypothetical protein